MTFRAIFGGEDNLSENERQILVKAEGGIVINELIEEEKETEQNHVQSSSSTEDTPTPLVQVQPKTSLRFRHTMYAMIMVIFAGFTFTGANVIQKLSCPRLQYLPLLFHRSCFQTILLSLYLCKSRVDMKGLEGTRKWLFVQGILGGILLICIFVAVRNVPLGSASAIFFCTPVFTFIFGAFLLEGEFFGVFRAIICCFMIFGVTFITRPEFIFNDVEEMIRNDKNVTGNGSSILTLYMSYYQASSRPSSLLMEEARPLDYYLLVALLVPVLSAVVSICTRKCKKVDIGLVTFYFGVGSLFVSIIGLAFKGDDFNDLFYSLSGKQWICTFGIIILGISGNFLYTGAVRYISPTKANVFRSFEVVLNSVLQYFLEGILFQATSFIGIAMLLTAMFLTGFEKEIVTRVNRQWFGRHVQKG